MYLMAKHEELETIGLGFLGEDRSIYSYKYDQKSTETGNKIVLTLFSNVNLKIITIHDFKQTGNIFDRLPRNLPNLEILNLRYWYKLVDNEVIEILSRSKQNLRVLSLNCSSITGIGLEEGVNSLPNLEKLILKGCKNLKDEGLKEILKISGSKLRVLDLSDTDITGIGLEEGDYCLTSLETLNLANCQELTDGGLVKILRISGSKLIVLTLADTNITGMGLEKEVKALPMLENLKLSFCCNLTDEGLVANI